MIKIFIFLILISALLGFTIKTDFNDKNIVYKKYSSYEVWYNTTTKIPILVHYQLTKDQVKKINSVKRFSNFKEDINLQTANPAIYKNSGYEKGHLFSAETASYSEISENECFYMSNVSPMTSLLNRGVWLKLENLERKLDELDIYAGTINVYIKNNLYIPEYFFKIINNKNEIYLFVQNPKNKNINDYKINKEKLNEILKVKLIQ